MAQSDFVEESLKQLIGVANKYIDNKEFDADKLSDEFMSIDAFRDMKAYLQSEENQREVQPFEALNQEFVSLHAQYKNSFEDMHRDAEQKAFRREYASGCMGLHRGYYSPSHTDSIAQGVSRGHLLKRKGSRYAYEYVFDADDNLICVYGYGYHNKSRVPVTTELFVRKKDIVQSFVFERDLNGWKNLDYISECRYKDGKIMEYRIAFCGLIDSESSAKRGKQCAEVDVEAYDYEGDAIKTFRWYRYLTSSKMLSADKFTFTRDESGKVLSFNSESIDGYQKWVKENHKKQQ